MTHSEIAHKYARDVVEGKVEACEYVRQACQRHLEDLERKDWPYYWSDQEADRVIKFVEMLPHVKGEWGAKRQSIILQPWQKFILCSIFGWRGPDNTRRFRAAYIEVPRKNGKALDIDTPIPTPDGWSKLRDIHPGHEVFDEHGNPCKVVAETPIQLDRPCYEVKFLDGSSIVADAEHEWLTDTISEGVPYIKTTRDIHDTLLRGREWNHRIPLSGSWHPFGRAAPIVSCDPVASRPVKCIQVDSPSHLYLAGSAMIPTHNSLISAAVGLYMFCMDEQLSYCSEVYCGATTEKQAWEVFRPARLMVQRTPMLMEAKGIQVNAKTLSRASDGSRFEPLIGNPGDGSSPSCAIIDEVHEHEKPDQIITMETGMGARKSPILFMITTAGFNMEGPCYHKRGEVVKMLSRAIPQDTLFGLIYTIDATDDWTQPNVLKKANPNLGVSIYEDYLANQQVNAVNNTHKQNEFKTKHLNVWVSARDQWINMVQWNKLADVSLSMDDFEGQSCYVGVDLASKVDLCALCYIFPRQIDGKRHYFVFPEFYLPEDTIYEHASKNASIYQSWVNSGHLIATDGAEIDYNFIRDRVLSKAERFDIVEIPHDPWNSSQFAHQLQEQGLTPVKIPQTVMYLSPAMKEIEGAIQAGRLHHAGHPVLTWCMSNVTVKADAKDNIFPRKDRMESKIDGAVCLITGMNRAMLEDNGASAYESEGLLIL